MGIFNYETIKNILFLSTIILYNKNTVTKIEAFPTQYS